MRLLHAGGQPIGGGELAQPEVGRDVRLAVVRAHRWPSATTTSSPDNREALRPSGSSISWCCPRTVTDAGITSPTAGATPLSRPVAAVRSAWRVVQAGFGARSRAGIRAVERGDGDRVSVTGETFPGARGADSSTLHTGDEPTVRPS